MRRRSRKSIASGNLENEPQPSPPPPPRKKSRRSALIVHKENNSLYCFPRNSKFRILSSRLVKQKAYFYTIVFCIVISILELGIERSLLDPTSMKANVLFGLDIALFTIFMIDIFLKVISVGFLFNGDQSYLKNPWNMLDFVLVMFSVC